MLANDAAIQMKEVHQTVLTCSNKVCQMLINAEKAEKRTVVVKKNLDLN